MSIRQTVSWLLLFIQSFYQRNKPWRTKVLPTRLRLLNRERRNGADGLLQKYVQRIVDEFKGQDLTAVLMGIAYGGDVEMCAKILAGRGKVYGYDTFEELHPKHLAKDQTALEATCMEEVYTSFGVQELSVDYQRHTLSEIGLSNATLIKGIVDRNSCADLPNIHLAWLDMDLTASMEAGFHAVADKIVPGGYLLAHDVVPRGHIPTNYELFIDQKLVRPDEWEEVERCNGSYFIAWRKHG